MYSIITTEKFFEPIKNTVLSLSEEVIFERVGPYTYDSVIAAFEEAARVCCSVLIIDIDICSDNWLLQGIKIYRQARPLVRIVLFAPGRQPGDSKVGKMFNKGIYDIVAPDLSGINFEDSEDQDEVIILPSLKKTLESKAANFADALRWDVEVTLEVNAKIKQPTQKVRVEREIQERTVVVEKGKIIGTVVIAVAGTMNRIGTTHTAISIAKYLKDLKNKVCLAELFESKHFLNVKSSYEDVKVNGNMFTLDGIDFCPYNQNLSVLNILEDDYNYIILDMGVYNEEDPIFDEFKRATVKILVSGVKDWELPHLETILSTGDKLFKNKYYFNFSDKESFEMVKNSMDKLPCYLAPFSPQPFKSNNECSELYKDMLKDVLPYSSDNKSGGNSKLFSFLKSKT